jgi:hypothetical protein
VCLFYVDFPLRKSKFALAVRIIRVCGRVRQQTAMSSGLRKGPDSDGSPNGGCGLSSGGATKCAAGDNQMGRVNNRVRCAIESSSVRIRQGWRRGGNDGL